jgi:hypothetical protein
MSAMSELVTTIGIRLRWGDTPGPGTERLLYSYIIPALILHAVAKNRSSYTCQELLDLIRGPATCSDLDVSRTWDVSRRVARMALVDECIVRSVQHQRGALNAGKRVTHIQLADRGKRRSRGIRSHR